MKAQIASELRKLRTTRTVWGLLAGVVALSVLGAWGILSSGGVTAGATLAGLPVFLAGSTVTVVLAMVMGTRSYTDEARHGSIVPTLLATPDRRRVIAAKAVVIAAAGALLGLAATAMGAAFAIAWFAAEGVALTIGIGATAMVVAKMMAIGAAWALIGLGIGLAIGHQVAAIVGALVYLLIVEDIVSALVGGVGRFLPGNASEAVLGFSIGDAAVVAPIAGAGLVVGYVALSMAAGTRRTLVRDVL